MAGLSPVDDIGGGFVAHRRPRWGSEVVDRRPPSRSFVRERRHQPRPCRRWPTPIARHVGDGRHRSRGMSAMADSHHAVRCATGTARGSRRRRTKDHPAWRQTQARATNRFPTFAPGGDEGACDRPALAPATRGDWPGRRDASMYGSDDPGPGSAGARKPLLPLEPVDRVLMATDAGAASNPANLTLLRGLARGLSGPPPLVGRPAASLGPHDEGIGSSDVESDTIYGRSRCRRPAVRLIDDEDDNHRAR